MNTLDELLDGESGRLDSLDVREATTASLRALRNDRRLDVLELDEAQYLSHHLFHTPDIRTFELGTGEYDEAEFDKHLSEARVYVHQMLVEVVDVDTLQNEKVQLMQRTLAARGGLMRVGEVPFRMNLYDRRLALLAKDFADNSAGAIAVREPSLISSLTALHARIWRTGERWQGHHRGTGSSGDLIDVLGELLAGSTDEAGARQLDLSLRTYRRRVRELLQLLGTTSRFQAGAIARERNYVDLVHPQNSMSTAAPDPYAEALIRIRSGLG